MVGLFIAHLGVTLFLQANLGSDTYNVLIQGISESIKNATAVTYITHGNTHIVISFLIILLLLLIDKSYIKIGTILCMLFGGPIIDMFIHLLGDFLNESLPMMMRILLNIIGCIILAIGMSIVIKSHAGTGPNDLVAVVLHDKLHMKFSLMRVLVDLSFVLLGFLLGGVIGLGTILCAALVGPVAGFIMPYCESLINRCVHK